jgi:DNA repair protein RadD
MQLRPYQLEAVAAVYNHLRTRDDNPCVVIPTGGGKTPISAKLCSDTVQQWNGRVLVVEPVKELIEQTADKLHAICPTVDVGIYSAGLNRRDTRQPIIVAGIQSIYERACDFEPFNLVIPDEAQRIPPDGEGMYQRLFGDLRTINPALRVVGLTATPFRMTTGPICTPGGILNAVCYEIGARPLIVDGYLSPLVSKAGKTKADTSGLSIQRGEFVASEVEALMGSLVEAACREIVELTANRKSILIFAAGVDHANDVAAVLSLIYGLSCRVVTGETPAGERATAVSEFKSGALRCLINVNVFTEGFDAPNVDCVVLLRPTLSPGLYYQMVGRGFRLAPGKADCLVLDFGGNVLRHGPIDALKLKDSKSSKSGEAPAKECPECQAVVAAGYAVCPECGFQFPPPERATHDATASNASVLREVQRTRYEVQDVLYSEHRKRNAPEGHPPTMRVDYQIALGQYKSQWLCFQHDRHSTGYRKAVEWWRKRSPDPIPPSVERAVIAARNGALTETYAITVDETPGDLPVFIDYELGPIPEPLEAVGERVLEEVPF